MTEDTIFVICQDQEPIYYTDTLEQCIQYCQDYFNNNYTDTNTTRYSFNRKDDFTFTITSRNINNITQYDRIDTTFDIAKVDKL